LRFERIIIWARLTFLHDNLLQDWLIFAFIYAPCVAFQIKKIEYMNSCAEIKIITQCFSFDIVSDDEIIFRKISTIRFLFRLYFRFVWKQFDPKFFLDFFRVQRTRHPGGVTWIFFYPSLLFGSFRSPNGIFFERQVAFNAGEEWLPSCFQLFPPPMLEHGGSGDSCSWILDQSSPTRKRQAQRGDEGRLESSSSTQAASTYRRSRTESWVSHFL